MERPRCGGAFSFAPYAVCSCGMKAVDFMPRRATSMTLDAALLNEARALGVNLSRAAEEDIAARTKAARAEAWQRENAEPIRNYTDYIEKNGLPLAE